MAKEYRITRNDESNGNKELVSGPNITTIQIGKLTVTITDLNTPSEDACNDYTNKLNRIISEGIK